MDYGGGLSVVPLPEGPISALRGLLTGRESLTADLLTDRQKEKQTRKAELDNYYILDSYAILALLNDEPSVPRIEMFLQQAKSNEITLFMSLINLSEIACIIERRWRQEKLRTVLAYLEEAPIKIVPATKERVFAAAHFKARYPIAYADAFAATLAKELSATLLTGDPEFQIISNQITVEWLSE